MGTLLGIVLLVAYGAGVWRFWRGFERTNFDPTLANRLGLSLLWPALIWNGRYRRNFTKALKG
ncbi:MAG: hypothetical protein BRC58_10410 [Cyanobacteria bacterium QS_8_64_29]|jgi:hypothetical protein|nr:MAG: hypothetical protein BRC58_10410 [Cyanobacteria bacterium QS_8_64_29]